MFNIFKNKKKPTPETPPELLTDDVQNLESVPSDDSSEEPAKKRRQLHIVKLIKKIRSINIRRTMAFKFAIVLVVLLAVFFSALSIILTRSIASDNIDTYTSFTTSLAERTADGLAYWLESFSKDFGIFTKSDAFKSGDFEYACEYLKENQNLIDPNFDFMGFADVNGQMFDSNGNITDISHKRYFTDIQTKGKSLCIADPEPSPDGYGYVFYISVPVNNSNNAFWGVMVGALTLGKINYQITKSTLSDNSFTYAIDSQGNIIAHPDSEKIMKNFFNMSDEESGYKGYKEMTQKMILAQTGSAIIKDSERNMTNRVFYCPIYHTDWSLAIAISSDEINSTARKSAFQISQISIIIAILLLIITATYMTLLAHPLHLLKNAIIEIASGDADLTKKIDVKTKDEVGDVVSGFNTFTDNLRHIIKRLKESKDKLSMVDLDMATTTSATSSSIKDIIVNISNVSSKISLQGDSVEQTAGKVNQIADSIEGLNQLIETQSSGVTEASAAVEEMIGNIISVTRSTEHMVNSFSELEKNTNSGIEKQSHVNEQIMRIQAQSKALMEANKVISKIATETNLLAMNASIEAAHAGDAGRGFSVVADEIHVLSETSSKQSKRIRDELSNIQESIEAVVRSSAEAQNSFQSVTSQIHETDQLVQQIKAAMEESEIGSHQITDVLKMMNDSTSEVRKASGSMSQGNKDILNQIEHLQSATEDIKNSVTHMTTSANQINDNGQTLIEISHVMQDSIAKIGSQIDLFKV